MPHPHTEEMKIKQKQTGRLASMLGHRLNVINKIMTTNPHTEEMNTGCCEKCYGSYVTGRDTRGCVENGCPCHKNSIWKKDWYEFCKLGGLHCTEEAQVMEQKINGHFFSKRKEELEEIKKEMGIMKLDYIPETGGNPYFGNGYNKAIDSVLSLLNKHISNK